MPLTAGQRVGSYEIVGALGVGGPPSLTAAFGRSFGASTVAMERT
jgi:hypothetical protein